MSLPGPKTKYQKLKKATMYLHMHLVTPPAMHNLTIGQWRALLWIIWLYNFCRHRSQLHQTHFTQLFWQITPCFLSKWIIGLLSKCIRIYIGAFERKEDLVLLYRDGDIAFRNFQLDVTDGVHHCNEDNTMAGAIVCIQDTQNTWLCQTLPMFPHVYNPCKPVVLFSLCWDLCTYWNYTYIYINIKRGASYCKSGRFIRYTFDITRI